jgi:nicotinamidase-related amidase
MQRRTVLTALGLAGLCCAAAPAMAATAIPTNPKKKENPMNATALVLIDLQNDYFPGGAFELEGAEAAAANARAVLDAYRKRGLAVIHVRHESVRPGSTFFLPGTPGADIHPLVAPLPGEPVVVKHYPNSFRETDLVARLTGLGVKHLVVVGMMTNMCVDATVRAAFDFGYEATVLGDACAAPTLTFDGEAIPARQVHGAFLAALAMVYAKVVPTADFLAQAGS